MFPQVLNPVGMHTHMASLRPSSAHKMLKRPKKVKNAFGVGVPSLVTIQDCSRGFNAANSFLGMTAACSTEVSQLEDENKKLSSRIELLERKIRAKDQLFDDSLATAFGQCACN